MRKSEKGMKRKSKYWSISLLFTAGSGYNKARHKLLSSAIKIKILTELNVRH